MKYNREYAFKYEGPESIPQDWTLNEDYSFDGSNLICDDMCAVLGNLVGYNLDGDRPIDVLIIQCLDEYEKKEIITTEFQEILEDAEVADVATPVATPEAGEVESGTTVTLSCETEGAVIYYTTDGTNPTSASTEYTEAIEITEETTIKAIAIKEGLDNSKVLSATYTIAGPTVYTGTLDELNQELYELPVNTRETAYLVNIIGTTASQWSTTGDETTEVTSSICCDRYVDLSPTTLPEGITSISNAFYSNDCVIRSPIIPNTVTDASMAFASSAITELPEIPNSVTNLYLAFNRNEMTTAPVIYANTQTEVNGTYMFMDCSNLTTVRFVGSNINLYDNYNYAFSGCTSLTTIYVETAEDKTIIYNKCHTADPSDSIVALAKIVVDPINNSENSGGEIGTIK